MPQLVNLPTKKTITPLTASEQIMLNTGTHCFELGSNINSASKYVGYNEPNSTDSQER